MTAIEPSGVALHLSRPIDAGEARAQLHALTDPDLRTMMTELLTALVARGMQVGEWIGDVTGMNERAKEAFKMLDDDELEYSARAMFAELERRRDVANADPPPDTQRSGLPATAHDLGTVIYPVPGAALKEHRLFNLGEPPDARPRLCFAVFVPIEMPDRKWQVFVLDGVRDYGTSTASPMARRLAVGPTREAAIVAALEADR